MPNVTAAVEVYKPAKREWWQKEPISYSFTDPRVRHYLGKVMGTTVVRVTDRNYMLKLQQRLVENHIEEQNQRIVERQSYELQRQKRLILEGRIPLSCTPKELASHPVFRITQLTQRILDSRRKTPRSAKAVQQPPIEYPVDEADSTMRDFQMTELTGEPPETMMAEEQDSRSDSALTGMSQSSDSLRTTLVSEEVDGGEEEEDLPPPGDVDTENLQLLNPEEIARDYADAYCDPGDAFAVAKYEDPLVTKLRALENVDEIYDMADEIIGYKRGSAVAVGTAAATHAED